MCVCCFFLFFHYFSLLFEMNDGLRSARLVLKQKSLFVIRINSVWILWVYMYVLYGLHSHIYKIMIINIMIVIVIKYLHFHLLHLICSMSFYYYYYNHFTYVLNSFFFIRWSLHMCIYMYQFLYSHFTSLFSLSGRSCEIEFVKFWV